MTFIQNKRVLVWIHDKSVSSTKTCGYAILLYLRFMKERRKEGRK